MSPNCRISPATPRPRTRASWKPSRWPGTKSTRTAPKPEHPEGASRSREAILGLTTWGLFPTLRHLSIKRLQRIERHLPLSAIRDQPLAVVIILHARQHSQRRSKIHQNPRAHSCEIRNLLHHPQLVVIQVFLIFLSPPLVGLAMFAEDSAPAEFADDDRLVPRRLPLHLVGIFRGSFIPSQVFIQSEHIQHFAERVGKNPQLWILPVDAIQSRCNQPGRIDFPRLLHQLLQKLQPLRLYWSFVGNRPQNDGSTVMVARNHLLQLCFC